MGLFGGRRKPLDEDAFWSLIGLLDGRTDEDAIARLRTGLRSKRDAVAFQQRLALVLFDLDREVLAEQRVHFDDMAPDDAPMPLSDDTFLYLRAGIVARGRDTVAAVIADPSLLGQGSWPDFEDLLYVAEEVVDDDIETEVSYETGSNSAYWSERAPFEEADLRPNPAVLECRDMSEPLEGVGYDDDGTPHPVVMHLPPGFLAWDDMHAVTQHLTDTIDAAGGLPADLGIAMVIAVVELGDVHDLEPEVRAPGSGRFDPSVVEQEVAVRATLAEVRTWPLDARRRGLLSLGARCVLAALPPDHGARDPLSAAVDAGRDVVGD